MFRTDLRHINTGSDSEVLVNVLAHELEKASVKLQPRAADDLHRGGERASAAEGRVCGGGDDRRLRRARVPRSVRHPARGDRLQRDRRRHRIHGGVRIGGARRARLPRAARRRARARRSSSTRTAASTASSARRTRASIRASSSTCTSRGPDSLIDGASVYETRLQHGREARARRSAASTAHLDIDVVIPIPGFEPALGAAARARRSACRTAKASSRTATSAAPSSCRGRRCARSSVRQKLNPMAMEFTGKNVLLVDDSIVRGTTSREIVQMAREAGARKVFFASAAPPVRFPNVYGIDMPTRAELIAAHRSEEEVAREIGADALIYQDLDELKDAVRARQPEADELRDLLLRRHLHHRRHHHRLPARDRDPARRRAATRATTRQRPAGSEPGTPDIVRFSRRFEPQLAGA